MHVAKNGVFALVPWHLYPHAEPFHVTAWLDPLVLPDLDMGPAFFTHHARHGCLNDLIVSAKNCLQNNEFLHWFPGFFRFSGGGVMSHGIVGSLTKSLLKCYVKYTRTEEPRWCTSQCREGFLAARYVAHHGVSCIVPDGDPPRSACRARNMCTSHPSPADLQVCWSLPVFLRDSTITHILALVKICDMEKNGWRYRISGKI